MKKTCITFLFLISFSFYGQIVTIPDANFKNALVNTNCATIIGQTALSDVDSNNDGEIQESEAMVVRDLYIDNFQISSLIGIAYFSNINYLFCSQNLLQELDLNGLSQIVYVECSDNLLTSLDFSQSNTLQGLRCENNLLSSLLLPVHTSPTDFGLDCSNNQLTTLDLGEFSFTSLNISNNNISNIEIPYTAFCEALNVSGNQYTSISLAAGEILEFYCSNTQLVNIDISGVDYFHYYLLISDNPNLQNINMQNNHADFCFDYPGDEQGPPKLCPFAAGILNNPSLSSICVDAIDVYNFSTNILVSETDYYAILLNDPNVIVSTECLLTTSENTSSLLMPLYPNPAENVINVNIATSITVQSITIYNPLGQIVKILPATNIGSSIPVDVSTFTAGSYFMEIISNQGKTTKKFVKM